MMEIGSLRRHAGCVVIAPSLTQAWDYHAQVLGREPRPDERPIAIYWCRHHHVWLTDGLPAPRASKG